MVLDAQTERQSDLRAIVNLLRRKLRLILAAMLFGISIAGIYLSYVVPTYTATALILIDPAERSLLQADLPINLNSNTADAIVTSEVEILRSDATAMATLHAFANRDQMDNVQVENGGVEDDGSHLAFETADLRALKSSTSVRRRGQTFVVAVSVTAETAQGAADLTNTLAEVYIKRQIDMKIENSVAARDVLEAQISAALAALTQSEQALQTYVEVNYERLTQESGSPKVMELRSSLAAATQNSDRLKVQAAEIARAKSDQDWEALAGSLNSPDIDALLEKRDALVGQVRFQLFDPSGISAEIDAIEQDISRIVSQRLQRIEEELSALQTTRSALSDEIRTQLLSPELSAEAVSEIFGLQQEVANAERQYDRLLSRMRDQEVEALVKVADSRIVSRALTPEHPTSPKRKLIFALATITGIGFGVALALVGEFYLGRVSSSAQLTHLTPAKFGTAVPMHRLASGQKTIADTVLDFPMSSFSEAFRRLRAGIDRSWRHREDAKVVMVTSPLHEEGKSVCALSLARTYASAGKITLLIDADMRGPTQQNLLGVKPEAGLVDFLSQVSKQVELEGFYVADRASNLAVILGNRRSDMPTDQLLLSDAFNRLLASARKLFDVIIIDTPPIVPIVDARYIAQSVDCGVICVRSSKTNQADLRNAYSQLNDAIAHDASIFTLLNFSNESDTTRL